MTASVQVMESVPSHPLLCGESIGGLRDGGGLESHCRLRKHAAVDGGAGDESGRGGSQDDALEVRSGTEGGGVRDDPHDVAGLRAPSKGDLLAGIDVHGPCDLKDPCVKGVAGEGAVVRELDAGPEFVQAGRKGLPP